jgi:hypothetical protein
MRWAWLGLLIACGPLVTRASAQPAPQSSANVLFLDFGGAATQLGSPEDATATPDPITMVATTTVPPFNGAVCAPRVTQQDAINAVVDRVRALFAPYAVQIVTSRPPSGPFTVVEIGGSHTLAGEPLGVAGVSATVDCGNVNPSNVVFDFSDDQKPDYGGVVSVAITAGHEAGHAFGLEHTDNPGDVMFVPPDPNNSMQQLPDLFSTRFTIGNFSATNVGSEPAQELCGRPNPLDNDAVLLATLGPSARSDTIAPMLDWSFPTQQPVTLSFPVIASASDNVGVKRVEVYKNLSLVAVLTAPPYTTTITAASGETFYVTVEAMDDAANRASITRLFSADANNAPLCPPQTLCPAGRACSQGVCRLALGQPCDGAADCASGLCVQVGAQTNKTCSAVCDASKPCPEAGTCAGGLCLPSAGSFKPDGAACAQASECASGRCAVVCVAACETHACDATAHCQSVEGGLGCVAIGADLGAPGAMPASGCALAPGDRSRAPLLCALLLATLLALRRRTRH